MAPSSSREIISGYGHKNLLSTHNTTLEFTKSSHLTKRGDCIVAVSINKSLIDLNAEFKERLCQSYAKLSIAIEASGILEKVTAQGSPKLILDHQTDMVVRKSDYICSRTLAIHADKAAQDLSRALVEKLKNPAERVKITLTVKD